MGACATIEVIGTPEMRDSTSIPPVYLWSGVGLAIANETGELYLVAGHFAGLDSYKEKVWTDEAVCLPASADLENAITRLGNGLTANARLAIEKLEHWVQYVRPKGPRNPLSAS